MGRNAGGKRMVRKSRRLVQSSIHTMQSLAVTVSGKTLGAQVFAMGTSVGSKSET